MQKKHDDNIIRAWFLCVAYSFFLQHRVESVESLRRCFITIIITMVIKELSGKNEVSTQNYFSTSHVSLFQVRSQFNDIKNTAVICRNGYSKDTKQCMLDRLKKTVRE